MGFVAERKVAGEVSYYFLDDEPEHEYRRIVGGIGWEGKRPGFSVVLGEDFKTDDAGIHHLFILKEYESSDTVDLLKRCLIFTRHYKVKPWSADTENKIEMGFLDKLNKGINYRFQLLIDKGPFSDDPRAFDYCLKIIEKVLSPHKTLHFGEESSIPAYLQEINPENQDSLRVDNYPAIAALGYAVGYLNTYEPTEPFSGGDDEKANEYDPLED